MCACCRLWCPENSDCIRNHTTLSVSESIILLRFSYSLTSHHLVWYFIAKFKPYPPQCTFAAFISFLKSFVFEKLLTQNGRNILWWVEIIWSCGRGKTVWKVSASNHCLCHWGCGNVYVCVCVCLCVHEISSCGNYFVLFLMQLIIFTMALVPQIECLAF